MARRRRRPAPARRRPTPARPERTCATRPASTGSAVSTVASIDDTRSRASTTRPPRPVDAQRRRGRIQLVDHGGSLPAHRAVRRGQRLAGHDVPDAGLPQRPARAPATAGRRPPCARRGRRRSSCRRDRGRRRIRSRPPRPPPPTARGWRAGRNRACDPRRVRAPTGCASTSMRSYTRPPASGGGAIGRRSTKASTRGRWARAREPAIVHGSSAGAAPRFMVATSAAAAIEPDGRHDGERRAQVDRGQRGEGAPRRSARPPPRGAGPSRPLRGGATRRAPPAPPGTARRGTTT